MNYITAPFRYLSVAAKWVSDILSRGAKLLYNQWLKFNHWVASITPGIKTKLITFLGAVGSLAGSTQEYLTGIPLNQMVTAEHAVMIAAGLFTLAFWFRGLSK